MAATEWVDDVLPGFQARTLRLGRDESGEVVATLVRLLPASPTGRAVLYVHGFVDYFFQAHMARAFVDRGWAFYAIDLRDHGRSIRPGRVPNMCSDIREYFADLTAAIDLIGAEQPGHLLLMAHSTGGLTSSLYLHDGDRRQRVAALLLNSPFFEFNVPFVLERVLPVVAAAARVAPEMQTGALPPFYGQSIHSSQRGEWDYDLAWKPLAGFPPRLRWVRAVRRAQHELQAGLAIEVPVLVLRSARTAWGTRRWKDEFTSADIVLDVAHIARYSPGLGRDVRVVALDGALHDVVLSAQPVRAKALQLMIDWAGDNVVSL